MTPCPCRQKKSYARSLASCLMLGFCVLIPFSDAAGEAARRRVPAAAASSSSGSSRRRRCCCRWPWPGGPRSFPRPPPAGSCGWRRSHGACRSSACALMFSALCACCRWRMRWPSPSSCPSSCWLLGRYVLDEGVGPRRLAACAVGFIGHALMVVQPSFAGRGAGRAAAGLRVAVIFAFFMLVTRQGSPKDVDPIALQGLGGLIGLPIPAAAAGPAADRRHAAPDRLDRPARCRRALAAGGARRHRIGGSSADDMVAALCPLGHAGADAVPRDSGGGRGRAADFQRISPAALALRRHRDHRGLGALHRSASATSDRQQAREVALAGPPATAGGLSGPASAAPRRRRAAAQDAGIGPDPAERRPAPGRAAPAGPCCRTGNCGVKAALIILVGRHMPAPRTGVEAQRLLAPRLREARETRASASSSAMLAPCPSCGAGRR